jgi:transposase
MTTATALDPTTLPDDIEALKKIILQYDQQLQESKQKLQDRDQYVLRLQHMLAQLRRWQFGTKAERIPEGQLIFPFYGTLETVPAPPGDENRAPRARRRPKRGGYRVIPKDIPQKIVVVDLPPDQRLCPDCHHERILMGYEETKQLDFNPASFFELVTRRAKYACKPCEGHLQTAPLPVPAGPIERGLPGFGLLAQVIIAKFCDHIPLYRQTRIYARQGVEIPRSTLCGWVGHGMRLLDPIVGAIVKDILLSRIIGTDDTVVRLLVPGLGRTAQARLWSYLGDAHHNQVAYEFTPNRKEEHPLRFLENFRGLVQADAYKGYDKLFVEGSGREELGCMTHMRRYFFEARDTDPERGGTALGFVRMLYAVEAVAAPMTPQERVALRREKSLPILTSLKAWMDQEAIKVLPQSPIGAAFHYAIAQWKALTRYVDEGEASIDNNAVERSLRGVVVGRKNYLFMGSEEGGRWAATAYSLIESCKLNGVEPYRYLKDVLRRVWIHPQSRIEELMPRLWKPPPDGP